MSRLSLHDPEVERANEAEAGRVSKKLIAGASTITRLRRFGSPDHRLPAAGSDFADRFADVQIVAFMRLDLVS